MGYYTHYTIEIDDKHEQVPSCKHKPGNVKFCPECGVAVEMVNLHDKIVQYLKENIDNGYSLSEIVDIPSDEWKWYEHESDMKEISKKFPTVIFTLIGDGEDSSDMWKKYFKNGKMQIAKAVISFDSFNEKLLK